MTSVIPYMAQVAATDQLLIGLQSLTAPIIIHFSMTDISIFNRIRA